MARGGHSNAGRSTLAGLWAAVTKLQSDFSALGGGSGVTDGGVSTVKLADGAVTTPKIADGAVNSAKIADLGIATGDIADSAITTAKIADGTIATGDIADGAVNSAKIADLGIATGDIADGAITTAKILDGTIADADLADSTLTNRKFSDNARLGGFQPTGALAQTMPRWAVTGSSALASGTLTVAGILVPVGRAITAMNVLPSAAGTAITNQAFYLIDPTTLNVVAVTADGTSTAFATTAPRTINFTSQYTPTSSLLYVGLHVTATTTAPSIRGVSTSTGLAGVAPILAATANTGLTTPLAVGTTIGALTAAAFVPWVWLT